MSLITFLGYKRSTLEEFYLWQGENGNPTVGTVNYIMGFNTNNTKTHRYTFPVIHKDSTCELNGDSMPIIGSIQGAEKDVIYLIDSSCPINKIPDNLINQEEFDSLNWVNI